MVPQKVFLLKNYMLNQFYFFVSCFSMWINLNSERHQRSWENSQKPLISLSKPHQRIFLQQQVISIIQVFSKGNTVCCFFFWNRSGFWVKSYPYNETFDEIHVFDTFGSILMGLQLVSFPCLKYRNYIRLFQSCWEIAFIYCIVKTR